VVVAVEDAAVLPLELLGRNGGRDRLANLARRRPDVGQVHGRAVGAAPERLGREIGPDVTGQRIRDDERRRGQIARAHERVDPALEVPVAGEDGDHGQVTLLDGRGHVVGQRSGVADARRAAEPDEREAELVQVGRQARGLQVVRDDARSGGERGLHP
jgi:hypothetical protein